MLGMETFVLNASRGVIIQDLQPKYVMNYLVEKRVVTDDQCNIILSEAREETQTRLLLDVVERGGSRAYDVFKRCLVKDNIYYWLSDAIHNNEIDYERQAANTLSLENMLIRGGVPMLPVNHIHRPACEDRVRQTLITAFNDNKSGGWVVIHGMPGGGKTLIAASVVRGEDLRRTLYPNGVYWLKIGNGNEANLLSKMHSLCEKLDPSFRNSLPIDLDMATDRLATILAKDENHASLIVLDDVWNDNVVRHFDFGCRVLVTTTVKSIADVASNKVFYVEMMSGFTLDESKRFFASSLGLAVNQLPDAAEEIWQRTAGFPLIAAIVTADVKVHPNRISEAFDRYLTRLHEKTLVNLSVKTSYQHQCLAQALQMRVDSLEEMKSNYYDLAIFPLSEYVSEHVLAVLWDIDTWDVEERMNAITDKSLALKVPNGRHTNYYHVHGLFIDHILNTAKNSLPARHERLINEYLKKCDGKYEDLPSDGYILNYLGYHLYHAQMFDKFPEVYLDLKFIAAKLKSNGFADVIGDYDKYKEHINKTKEHSKKFSDFRDFIKFCRAYGTESINRDIIQLALFQPADSDVYKQAKRICLERPNDTYIEWCNRKNVLCRNFSSHQSKHQYHTHNVNYAMFASDGEHVISVGDDFFVRVWNSKTSNERLRMPLNNGNVLCCATAFDQQTRTDIILTCLDANTAAVWYLSYNDYNWEPHNKVGKRLSSQVQYIESPNLLFEEHTSKVMACSMTKCGSKAATMDASGIIKVWSPKDGSLFSSWEAHTQSFNISSCDFSPDGNYLVSAAGTFLVLWRVQNGLPKWEFEDRDHIFNCCRYSNDGSVVVAAVDYKLSVFSTRNGARLFFLCEPTKTPILGCAISGDGRLVAASTTNQSVIVWNLDDKKVVDIFRGRSGWVRSVSFAGNISRTAIASNASKYQSTYRLISSHKCGIVMIWRTSGDSEVKETLLRELLSVRFDANDNPTSAVVDVNNKIQVRKNEKQNVFTEENGSVSCSQLIRCCVLSHKCDRVLYGTTSGFLKVFDVGSGTVMTLRHMTNSEISCCAFSNNDEIIAAGFNFGAIAIFINNVFVEVTTIDHISSITKLLFYTNDTKILSSSFDNTLRVWDSTTGKQLICLTGHTGTVLNCDISMDGNLIVSASADKTLMLWNASCGSQLAMLEKHEDCVRSCCFAPITTLNLVASGDDLGIVAIWRYKCSRVDTSDVDVTMSTELLAIITAFVTPGCWVYDLAFSSDGSQLVTATDTIQWWDTNDFLRDRRPLSVNGTATNNQAFAISPQRSIPVQGSHVARLVASPRFSSFVAVDDAGILYHFKKVKPPMIS